MKTYWGVEVYLHAFLTSALDGGEWSALCSCRFTPRERAPGTHWIGGWAGPRAGLDAAVREKFPAPAGTRTPDHPAHSLALYRWAIPALSFGYTCTSTAAGMLQLSYTDIFRFVIFYSEVCDFCHTCFTSATNWINMSVRIVCIKESG
jgi:hypothetical protein